MSLVAFADGRLPPRLVPFRPHPTQVRGGVRVVRAAPSTDERAALDLLRLETKVLEAVVRGAAVGGRGGGRVPVVVRATTVVVVVVTPHDPLPVRARGLLGLPTPAELGGGGGGDASDLRGAGPFRQPRRLSRRRRCLSLGLCLGSSSAVVDPRSALLREVDDGDVRDGGDVRGGPHVSLVPPREPLGREVEAEPIEGRIERHRVRVWRVRDDRGERVADVARGEPLRDELVVRASEFLAG